MPATLNSKNISIHFFKGLHSAHGTGLNVLSQTPLEHPETINLNRSPETAYLAFCLLPNAKTHAMLNLQSDLN